LDHIGRFFPIFLLLAKGDVLGNRDFFLFFLRYGLPMINDTTVAGLSAFDRHFFVSMKFFLLVVCVLFEFTIIFRVFFDV